MIKKVVLIEDQEMFIEAWLVLLATFSGVEVEVINSADKISAEKIASLVIEKAYFILDDHLWNGWSGRGIAAELKRTGCTTEKILFCSRNNIDGYLNIHVGGGKIDSLEDMTDWERKLLVRKIEAFLEGHVRNTHFLTRHGVEMPSSPEIQKLLGEMSDERYTRV